MSNQTECGHGSFDPKTNSCICQTLWIVRDELTLSPTCSISAVGVWVASVGAGVLSLMLFFAALEFLIRTRVSMVHENVKAFYRFQLIGSLPLGVRCVLAVSGYRSFEMSLVPAILDWIGNAAILSSLMNLPMAWRETSNFSCLPFLGRHLWKLIAMTWTSLCIVKLGSPVIAFSDWDVALDLLPQFFIASFAHSCLTLIIVLTITLTIRYHMREELNALTVRGVYPNSKAVTSLQKTTNTLLIYACGFGFVLFLQLGFLSAVLWPRFDRQRTLIMICASYTTIVFSLVESCINSESRRYISPNPIVRIAAKDDDDSSFTTFASTGSESLLSEMSVNTKNNKSFEVGGGRHNTAADYMRQAAKDAAKAHNEKHKDKDKDKEREWERAPKQNKSGHHERRSSHSGRGFGLIREAKYSPYSQNDVEADESEEQLMARPEGVNSIEQEVAQGEAQKH